MPLPLPPPHLPPMNMDTHNTAYLYLYFNVSASVHSWPGQTVFSVSGNYV